MFADESWGDFCGRGLCCSFLVIMLFCWAIGSAVSSTASAVKKAATSDTAKEVGTGVLAWWLRSMFR